jgi:KTSC domain
MNDTHEIPNLQAVQSSMFDGVAFDETRWTLTLVFKSGLILAYQQVPPEEYETFIAAKSLGKHYNANVKDKYKALVVREAGEPHERMQEKAASPQQESPPPNGTDAAKGSGQQAEPDSTHGSQESDKPQATVIETEFIKIPPSDKKLGPFLMQDCYVHMGVTKHWQRPDGSWVCEQCHPNPSRKAAVSPPSATQDESQGLSRAPMLLEPLEAPKTPQDAITLLSENDGLIQATIRGNRELAAESMKLAVSDAKTYETAGNQLKVLVTARDRAFKFLDPIRAVLLKPYQLAQQRLKEATDPIDTATAHLKQHRIRWFNEQEAIRIAEEARLRKLQEEQAEAERKARGEQLTLGAIDEALAGGDHATAEALLNEPIAAPPEYLPPVRVESIVPQVQGISRRSKWIGEVTNFEDLILDVASGICSVRDGKGLLGHAPPSFLEANMTAINLSAKSQKKAFNYAGLKAYDAGSESVRRAK